MRIEYDREPADCLDSLLRPELAKFGSVWNELGPEYILSFVLDLGTAWIEEEVVTYVPDVEVPEPGMPKSLFHINPLPWILPQTLL